MINKSKVILVAFIVVVAIIFIGFKESFTNKTMILPYRMSSNVSATTPSKEEIIKQIDLGISVIDEAIENFVKENPGKKPEEKLNNYGESSLKQVQTLKELKSKLQYNEISNEKAWNKVLEIRDRKSNSK